MQTFGLDRAWRAGLMLLACLLLSAAFAFAVRASARPLLLEAYTQRFSFMPGHWFGERVAGLRAATSPTCVVLGASNAREAFDPITLEAAVPKVDFINAATTGGNNEVLEVQAAILQENSIKPRCVVAGVSTWMMFKDGSPLITAEEYLGLLEWDGVLGLSSMPLFSKEGHRIAFGLVLPLRSQARQINRVTRRAIMDARASTISVLPVRRYETYPGELKPADDYLYLHTPSHLRRDWDKLVERSRPWYAAGRYGGELQERSLRSALDRLLTVSPNVVLVVTPQTPILDPASQAGSRYFWATVRSYRGRVTVIDCSRLNDLSLFIDEGHLNANGRMQISKELGPMLNAKLAGAAPLSAMHCSVVQ